MTATVLGKRKSRTQKTGPSISREDAQAMLARHFESQFLPLFPTVKPTPAPETEDPASSSHASDDNSWDGFSEDEAEPEPSNPLSAVEVISHTEAYSTVTTSVIDKRESRAWLSSRPPASTSTDSSSSSTSRKAKTTADEDAPSLLKNDLALQRLLSESHLFSSAAAKGESTESGDLFGGASTEHVGRNRHLATDLRLASLGSKTSIYKQAKMPMSFRKGIQAAASEREAKRRREAKENGIVLERPGASALGKKTSREKRKSPGRAIDAPAVGRMSNGMLKLSKKDIADIEGGGPRKGSGFTKKKRR
ncbi:hypothetical protein F5Y19DRAFT_121921 [Xylariaceae sp. FL1651]|nr:hypothetical protein F5Y19DRAFT_121921 [Xylariaceae sp. FL1651]